MPQKSADLHGSAPDRCRVALLLIDVVNDLEFEGGEALLEQALTAAEAIAALKRRARAAGIPVVYVNDNFGRWQSDLQALVRHAGEGTRGAPLVRRLLPAEDDYFVLKPKHSGFFQTVLDLLLEHLGATTLILAGFAGDICVLFTANDAYLRDYRLIVPADCTASLSPEANRQALDLMRRVLRAELTPSAEIDLDALVAGEEEGDEGKAEAGAAGRSRAARAAGE